MTAEERAGVESFLAFQRYIEQHGRFVNAPGERVCLLCEISGRTCDQCQQEFGALHPSVGLMQVLPSTFRAHDPTLDLPKVPQVGGEYRGYWRGTVGDYRELCGLEGWYPDPSRYPGAPYPRWPPSFQEINDLIPEALDEYRHKDGPVVISFQGKVEHYGECLTIGGENVVDRLDDAIYGRPPELRQPVTVYWRVAGQPVEQHQGGMYVDDGYAGCGDPDCCPDEPARLEVDGFDLLDQLENLVGKQVELWVADGPIEPE